MIVMKFGGTSIQDEACLKRVTGIVRSRIEQQPVLVFSAMGKTTRNLLETAEQAAAGRLRDAEEHLAGIRRYHRELAESVVPDSGKHALEESLQTYFHEVQEFLGGLCRLGELSPSSQDRILSYGELISTSITTEVLRQQGIQAEWLDSRRFIVTDERHTSAEPVEEAVGPKVREHILPVIESGRVPVIQGFIGATRDGATTTLGFEGSDFTASLVGAALEVEEIQVWKDVPGMMTADPALLDDVRVVEALSFDEAGELARFGAKVLHPRSIGPARRKGIPVRICHSREPDSAGTRISSDARPGASRVKSIAYKRSLLFLRVAARDGVSSYNFLKSVFDVLDRERIAPLVASTADGAAVLAVDAARNLNVLIDDLRHLGAVEIREGKASVTMVGEGLRDAPDFLPLLFSHLKGENVDLVSHGASLVSRTLIVDEEALPSVLEKVHRFCFYKK